MTATSRETPRLSRAAALLRTYRLDQDLSVKVLADRWRLSVTIIYYWEQGRQVPGVPMRARIERWTRGTVPVSAWNEL